MRSGSPRLGLVLLCFFVVPGVLYFLWFFCSGHWGCSTCGSREVVPLLEREAFHIRAMQTGERLA